MTTSGPTLPPVTQAAQTQTASSRQEQAVKIEAVRGGTVGDPVRATRLEGEVVRVDKDARIATIRTESGIEADIALRGRVTLAEGDQVEIDLPPGRPPPQAVLRPSEDLPDIPPPAAAAIQQTQTAMPAPVQNTDVPRPAPSPPIEQPDLLELPVRITQSILPPDIRAVIDTFYPAEEHMPVLSSTPPAAPVPLMPNVVVRIASVPAQFLPSYAPELQVATLSAAAFDSAPVLSAPHMLPIQPIASPFPAENAPALSSALLQPALHAPAELIRTEMPDLQNELRYLPPGMQAAGHTVGMILHDSAVPTLNSAMPSPLPVAPAIVQTQGFTTPVLPHAELPTDVRSHASAIRAPDAFITNHTSLRPIFPDPVPGTLHFMASIAQSSPSISLIPPGVTLEASAKTDAGHHLLTELPPLAVIEAKVVGVTKNHFPILSVSIPGSHEPQFFVMQFPASNLPVGAEVQLVPQTPLMAVPAPQIIASGTPSQPFQILGGWTWPALDDALTYFVQVAQPQAAQSLANIIPNAGDARQMPPAIMFLMAAIKAGDLAGWMGDKSIDILRRDGGRGADILSRLSRDFAGQSRMSSEPVSQDWRAMAIPMIWQNDIQKIHLYYRHSGGEKDPDDPDRKQDKSTRFIFDLNLSQMGELQLDGLMRGQRLDLILRSRSQFSLPMQNTMREKYLDILETGHLTGDLAFQHRLDQWVTVESKPESWENMV